MWKRWPRPLRESAPYLELQGRTSANSWPARSLAAPNSALSTVRTSAKWPCQSFKTKRHLTETLSGAPRQVVFAVGPHEGETRTACRDPRGLRNYNKAAGDA